MGQIFVSPLIDDSFQDFDEILDDTIDICDTDECSEHELNRRILLTFVDVEMKLNYKIKTHNPEVVV